MDCNNCNQNANCFNHNNMNMPRNGRYNRGNCNRMMPGSRPMPEQECGCEMNNNVRERKMDNPNRGMERNTMNHSIGNDNHRCGCNMTYDNQGCGCNMKRNNEGCDRGTEHVDHMAPGMCFVPWQKWQDVYNIDQAIGCVTIFKELYKPYVGRGCGR